MQWPSEDTTATVNSTYVIEVLLALLMPWVPVQLKSRVSRHTELWCLCVVGVNAGLWMGLRGFCACGTLPGSLWLSLAEGSRFLELIREMDNSRPSKLLYASFLLSLFHSFTLSGSLSPFLLDFHSKLSTVLGKLKLKYLSNAQATLLKKFTASYL